MKSTYNIPVTSNVLSIYLGSLLRGRPANIPIGKTPESPSQEEVHCVCEFRAQISKESNRVFYDFALIIHYIADLPLNTLLSPSSKSDNIVVPFASLRSLILLFDPTSLTFTSSTRGMLD